MASTTRRGNLAPAPAFGKIAPSIENSLMRETDPAARDAHAELPCIAIGSKRLLPAQVEIDQMRGRLGRRPAATAMVEQDFATRQAPAVAATLARRAG